jgi:ribosomal protein L29
MKRNDIKKLVNKTPAELVKDIAESKEKLWELRREIAAGKVKNAHSKSVLRRDIARMFTVMQNKQTSK